MGFLITSHGKSGTLWLSTIMDCSAVYTVKHEPEKRPFNIFKDPFYGEVNSQLRGHVDQIPWDKLGIILRHPLEILSPKWEDSGAFTREHNDAFLKLDYAIQKYHPYIISFKKLVSDKDYCQQVIRDFGILDVKVTDEDINTPVNSRRYKTLWLRDMSAFQWFINKYQDYL